MLRISLKTPLPATVAILFLVLLTVSAFSQKKVPATKPATRPRTAACTLQINEAPRLRGFFLGQSEEEIKAAIPSFHTAYETAKDLMFPVRDVNSDFREVRSDLLTQDLTQNEEYSDVSFVWQLWGGRVVQLQVTYEEYEPMNMNDFLEQVSSTTGLPIKAFHVVNPHTQAAKCDGFSIIVKEGSMTKTGWVPQESQVILLDTTAIAALDAEEKQVKKERAEEDAKKKADAEKKKRTFKP
jgi:hypothetical protein